MNPRGLTLIEVLAATVLLGITAAACVPIITSAVRVLHEEQATTFTLDDLAIFADSVLADPELFGLTATELQELDLVEIPWPDVGISVTVQSIGADDAEVRYSLLVFSVRRDDGSVRTVFRWIEPAPPQEESPQ